MSLTLTIPKEYGYILATATLSTIVSIFHTMNTGKFRKLAQVPYPNAYCTEADAKADKKKYLFNCAQRAQANFGENQPQFLVSLLVGGLRYPVLTAGLGAVWCAARVMYTIGYCREDKERGAGRLAGFHTSSLAQIAMIVISGLTSYQMIMN